MYTFLTVIHLIACLLLVLVVLVQSGKGAELSTSLSGSSQTVFGSSGGANFFTRFTALTAVVFMMTSVGLTLLGSQNRKSVFEQLPMTAEKDVPTASVSQVPAPVDKALPSKEKQPLQSKQPHKKAGKKLTHE